MPHKAAKLPDADIDADRPLDRPRRALRPARWSSRAGEPRQAARRRPTRTATSGRSGRLKAVEPPAVKDEAWARTPIDRFILAALERHGLDAEPAGRPPDA